MGRIYEQLEKYGEALRDYIAALDSNRNDSTLHQAIRRVRGLACEEDRKQAKAEQDNVFRSVPRPCLPQFENRGKAKRVLLVKAVYYSLAMYYYF